MLSHVASTIADILPIHEMHPSKVRSVRMPKTKSSQKLSPNALILDSGANIHILNNPNFLSCITSCLGQYINITGSCTLRNKMGQLCGEFNSIPLPTTGYLYQPNSIDNIISLSLLSDTYWIIMDTDVENAFYIFNRDDGSYMKYTRCATLNSYTYVV